MLKNKLEALLFSSGRRMSLEELSKLTRTKEEELTPILEELQADLKAKESSVMLINEGQFWKLSVHEQFLPLVRKIVTQTELSKTILETLAVIAFRYPIKQSDLIKIRTNKAYDHLRELEELGYISRQRHGRTNLIKLTQKFFEYFDLAEDQLKDKFSSFQSIANAIAAKEQEVRDIKQKQAEEAAAEKTDEQIQQETSELGETEEGESTPESENQSEETRDDAPVEETTSEDSGDKESVPEETKQEEPPADEIQSDPDEEKKDDAQ